MRLSPSLTGTDTSTDLTYGCDIGVIHRGPLSEACRAKADFLLPVIRH